MTILAYRKNLVPALLLAAATLTSSWAFAQEMELPQIRISRGPGEPSESLETDDVEHPRTARVQPFEALPGPDAVVGESVIESLNGADGSIMPVEGSRSRRRRERHSSILFGQEYGRPSYDSPLLGGQRPSRLTRTPPMFGDTGGSVAKLKVSPFKADLPLAGASRLVKIAEHNQAVPLDRVFLSYHHFHNAAEIENAVGAGASESVDQWLLGIEKTLWCSDWSVELRMPFSQRIDMAVGGLEIDSGHWGDVLISLKRLMHRGDSFAIASGVGVTLPIGSGVNASFNNINLEIENDAVHFLPYVGITSDSPSGFFYHGFFQLDIPFNGNDAIAREGGTIERKTFDELSLWHLDVAAGFWLYRPEQCCQCGWCVSGIAPVVELHYTSSFLDNSQAIFNQLGQPVTLAADAFSVLNVTFGIHAEFGPATLRLGAAFPFGAATSELFDAEFQATVMLRM